MMTRLFKLMIAAAACWPLAATSAEHEYVTSERAIEATSASLVLPSGPGSMLVVTPCGGCTPMSLLASASTVYFLKRQQVGLAQFRAALAGKSDIYVSVFQSTRTGELTRLVAAVDAPTPARAR
jgi:hypothetical protein